MNFFIEIIILSVSPIHADITGDGVVANITIFLELELVTVLTLLDPSIVNYRQMCDWAILQAIFVVQEVEAIFTLSANSLTGSAAFASFILTSFAEFLRIIFNDRLWVEGFEIVIGVVGVGDKIWVHDLAVIGRAFSHTVEDSWCLFTDVPFIPARFAF